MGYSDGMSLERFREVFGGDYFYSTIGLAEDDIYHAHRQGGRMASLYRQLGLGFEHLLRTIIMDCLGL